MNNETKKYVLFSLLAGVASIIAGLAVRILADNAFVALLGISLVIGIATVWHYDAFNRLFGPVLAVAAVMAAYTIFALTTAKATFGVKLASSYGIGWMVLGYPAIVLAYALLLFLPSFAFFLVMKKSKGPISRNRNYVIFSLLAGAASVLAATAAFALTSGMPRVPFAVLAAALVISIPTAVMHSRVKMLLGPIIVAALVSAVWFGWMSVKNGQSLFGDLIGSGEAMRLVLIELPLIFTAATTVAFAVSAVFYVVVKTVLRMAKLKHG